jgi:glycyl-tRNA synthetase beta chain
MTMDRELLLEIGCEELPASWLPGLTTQLGDVVAARLVANRLAPETPAETYSTPRRLTVRIARVTERQTDLEEIVSGPAIAAAFGADGQPTPAARGFASKQGVDVAALERIETPKGTYLAFRKRQRGKAAIDVLPTVLGETLRGLSFPKLMHWDAQLEDGKGELLFGRPIRWIVYLYGGRVVPFTIGRAAAAESRQVREVEAGAVTFGHRFLTTAGRAGRAIKVRTFDDYKARLLEHFVILDRGERHDKIVRELDAKAQRLQGRVRRIARGESALLQEVPDLVEYPAVVGGTFGEEFLELPDEVLTTTLIHHQHYFPVESVGGRIKNAFLAVTNMEPADEHTIARNAERVVTARLRDARFFWEADRTVPLESRIDRLSTLLFHKKLGSYQAKALRLSRLAEWIARDVLHASDETARGASLAARLAKADLATDMVREFTELQGVMGGIYAREEGLPEAVWRAIYYHYLPVGIEVDAPPSAVLLGSAAVTWAAVSLADKLDTIVGLFAAGERPTGSRDPFGLRRAAHGVFRVLVDLPALTGLEARPTVQALVDAADREHEIHLEPASKAALGAFLEERLSYLLQERGFDPRTVRAVTRNRQMDRLRPLDELKKLEVLPEFTRSDDFQRLATAFKRVSNISREVPAEEAARRDPPGGALAHPAEQALLAEIVERSPAIHGAVEDGRNFRAAFAEAAKFGPVVDRFFADVLVMDPDANIRRNRQWLLKRLEHLMLELADISQIVTDGDGRAS